MQPKKHKKTNSLLTSRQLPQDVRKAHGLKQFAALLPQKDSFNFIFTQSWSVSCLRLGCYYET